MKAATRTIGGTGSADGRLVRGPSAYGAASSADSLPWQPIVRRTWTRMLLLCVVINYCISQAAAELKSGIPTLSPAGISRFQPSEDVKYFRYLNLDLNEMKLYIGAMNYVIRINNIHDISKSSYDITKPLNTSPLFERDVVKCKSQLQSNVDYECQNHIRSVVPREDGSIEICGTSAYNQRLFKLDPNNFNTDSATLFATSSPGTGICPPSPNATCVVIYVKNGNPGNEPATYSATMMDFTTARPLIYRPKLQYSKLLRTENSDTKWLNEPYFVQSFDVGEYVYFFFRENAIEYMNCGKAVYSRVARVCKNDRGGNKVLTSRFTTYFKARLNCSIPGNYPFYFNELYDVFRIGDTFYGLFRTYNNGLFGSAVCAFTNADIEKAFDGPFKEQKESTSNWQRVPSVRVPEPRPGQCTEDSTKISDEVLQFIKARPLMDLSVQMKTGHPVFYQQEIMYEKMVVLSRSDMYNIYMLATDNNEIHKIVSWLEGETYQHKVITVWNGSSFNEQIHQLKLYDDHLYLSTDRNVIRIPVTQCEGYHFCTQCIQDPDCGWNNDATRCQPYRANTGLVQDVKASIPEQVCTDACKEDNIHQHRPRVFGDSIHLDCKSQCEPSGQVQWFFNDKLIKPDEKRFFLTVNNSLILLNVTTADNGTYTCKSQGVKLKEHAVVVIDCNDAESCWRLEFVRWCKAFDKYQEDMDQWRCLKKYSVDKGMCFLEGAKTCKIEN